MKDLGRNLSLLAAAFIAALAAGFWVPYLSGMPHFDVGISPAVHVHAAALFGWAALLLVQPLTIYGRAPRLHRALGMLSLVVMPVVVASSILMLHKEYLERIEQGASPWAGIKGEYLSAAQLAFVASLYAASIAAARRRRIDVHWRLIACIVLLLLPAGLSRTLGYGFDFRQVVSQAACMALNAIVLAALSLRDLRQVQGRTVFTRVLAAYLVMMIGWVILGLPV